MTPIQIAFEDNDLLIVEKPAGIPTQPPPPSLASLLAEAYPEIKKVGGSDWGAAHRLDRDTSGLVVFARHQEIYEKMREMFSKGQVWKEYVAWVEGKVEKKGQISWPIGSDPKSAKRVKVYKNIREARRNKAQEAVTAYMLSREGRGQTLLQIKIKTGCRHQIRAHLAAIGHPIVGDLLYGGPPHERMMLHAAHLAFKHPRTGAPIHASSGKTLPL